MVFFTTLNFVVYVVCINMLGVLMCSDILSFALLWFTKKAKVFWCDFGNILAFFFGGMRIFCHICGVKSSI